MLKSEHFILSKLYSIFPALTESNRLLYLLQNAGYIMNHSQLDEVMNVLTKRAQITVFRGMHGQTYYRLAETINEIPTSIIKK